MTITATCCSAYDFPDDDTIAIDYTKICNTATTTSTYYTLYYTISITIMITIVSTMVM